MVLCWLERGGRGLVLGVSKELRWRVFIPQPALGLVNVEFHKKGWPGLREGWRGVNAF